MGVEVSLRTARILILKPPHLQTHHCNLFLPLTTMVKGSDVLLILVRTHDVAQVKGAESLNRLLSSFHQLLLPSLRAVAAIY